MTITELKERIAKKEAQIEKKYNTISKKSAQIEKKTAKVKALGYDPQDKMGARDNTDAFWLICDIGYLEDDIRRGYEQIEECKATLAKYEAQLAGEMEKEATFISEVPEAMKTLEAELIDRWDADDKERREWLRAERKALDYKEFIKKHHYSGWEFTMITDEEIHKANTKDARAFIIDLLNRVKDITGEVTDWSYIHLSSGNTFPVLNGDVYGKEGRARVESILAGGYNIQRLHIRTLVKPF